jgi:hypothetical protein
MEFDLMRSRQRSKVSCKSYLWESALGEHAVEVSVMLTVTI